MWLPQELAVLMQAVPDGNSEDQPAGRASSERIAELVKANAALQEANASLRHGVARVAETGDIDALLSTFLAEVIHTSGADSGAAFLLTGRTPTELECRLNMTSEGELIHSDGVDEFVEVSARDDDHLFSNILNGPIVVIDMRAGDLQRPLPQVCEWHEQRGHRFSLNVPMRIGAHSIGFLGLAFRDKPDLTPTLLEMMEALALQMSLAAEITRLSERARTAVLTQERVQAAERHASELAKANKLLRSTARELVRASSPDDVLALFLQSSVEAAGADCGAVLRRTGETEVSFVSLLRDGEIISGDRLANLPMAAEVQKASREDRTGLFASLASGRSAWRLVSGHALDLPEVNRFHQQRHNEGVWDVPFQIGDRVSGFLGLSFRKPHEPDEMVKETIQALANQVGVALQLIVLADQSKAAALLKERELAAERRAGESARANAALQSAANALAAAASRQEFVPIVLRIITETFGISASMFFDVADDERVFLRYVCLRDRMLADDEVYQLARTSEDAEVWRRLRNGFTVEEAYLGTTSRKRIGPKVIDHGSGTVEPEFDRHAVSMGWGIELNVPLRVHDEVIAAITLLREEPLFASHEIELAVAFANQLSLAVQVVRLSERNHKVAVEQAITRERGLAAEQRAEELVKANEVLRSSVNELVSQTDEDSILTSLLQQSVVISGATSGVILKRIDASQFDYRLVLSAGVLHQPSEVMSSVARQEMRDMSKRDPDGYFSRLAQGEAMWRRTDDPGFARTLTRSARYHQALSNRRIYDFPFKVGNEVTGYLGLSFADFEPLGQTVQETVKALVTQVGLALELRLISERLERAAVEEERSKFARDLHDTLTQGYAAILMQLGAGSQVAPIPLLLQPFLNRIETLARQNLAEARRTVAELRNAKRTREPLEDRLADLTRQLTATFDRTIEFSLEGRPRRLDSSVEDELYLIAQEGLTNALRHAQPQYVEVGLTFHESGLHLKIKDDGIGIQPNPEWQTDHFGLRTMQERADRVGATFTIVSEAAFGTEILVAKAIPSTVHDHSTSSQLENEP